MNWDKYRFAFRQMAFLHSVIDNPTGVAELCGEPGRHLLVWHPDAIGEIFRLDRHMWLDGSDTLQPLVGYTSLLFANGAHHAAYRKVIGAPLRARQLPVHYDTIRDTAHDAIDEMLVASSVYLAQWTRELSLRIIGQIVLGTANRGLLERFTSCVDGAIGSRRRILAYRYLRVHSAVPSPWRAFLRRREEMSRELLDVARQGSCPTGTSQAAAVRQTTLSALLMSGADPLGVLDEGELRDQIMSLLFAGHETTASAIAWTLYWLERNDHIARDLRDELAATSADGSIAEDVPLLDAVCREALRISPPATVAGNRVLSEGRELLDQSMTKGTRLTPCIYLAHRRPDIYPHPHRFDPGRFLDARWSSPEYLPFGGGTRRCLGADLAMLEMRMVVAAVLRRVELRCLNPEVGVPHPRGPSMGPGRNLLMSVRARQ